MTACPHRRGLSDGHCPHRLGGSGYPVQAAIHLALLGTKLPGLDGLTTVTRLRQMHDLPVILLTSGTDSTENILGLTMRR